MKINVTKKNRAGTKNQNDTSQLELTFQENLKQNLLELRKHMKQLDQLIYQELQKVYLIYLMQLN